MDPVEIAGALLGFAYVVLAIRESAWCWPIGIGNALLFLIVCLHARLYGAAGLQAVYLVVSVYGWYEWLYGGKGHGRLTVTRTPVAWGALLLATGALFTVGFGLFLKQNTADPLPFADAATTGFSLVAQWMATRKWLENWLLWMVVDAGYVAVCVSQRLVPMASLYAVFLVMAVVGHRQWRASEARERAAAAEAGATVAREGE